MTVYSRVMRTRARLPDVLGTVHPFMRNRGDGLEFCFDVVPVDGRGVRTTVSLTHADRDKLIEEWARSEKEFINA